MNAATSPLRMRTPAGLYYQRNDPNDPRMGETITHTPEDYEQADIIILGCPQDDGVKRNHGRPGAKHAPKTIREQLYKLPALESVTVFDLGDTRVDAELEVVHARHQLLVRQVLRDGKRLVVLGGGNDVSFADASALALEESDVAALNIDTHFDVREDVRCHSGTPYRQLLEGSFLQPERFFELGFQPFANSVTYSQYLTDAGVRCVSCEELQTQGVSTVLRDVLTVHAKALFWGIDMDVVRAADAPGVSAVNPAGLSAQELLEIARIAGQDTRTRVFEITEVNPEFDNDARTSRLAAISIWYFMQGVTKGDPKCQTP